MPQMTLINVVLPAPFGPITPGEPRLEDRRERDVVEYPNAAEAHRKTPDAQCRLCAKRRRCTVGDALASLLIPVWRWAERPSD